MRVTSKGQVTIPVEIRRGLGIESGSEVNFVKRPDGVVQLVRDHGEPNPGIARARAVREWISQYSGSADLNGMTVDEYIDWIRGPREDLLPR
jgi:AbrB family looped-hinge helix DNA binding protein